MHYTKADILNLESYFRRNLINSLTGFKPANLVGTLNQEGQTNLAIFSSAVHIGATPPLVGLISRPHTVPRHTLENIKASDFFTINHVHTQIFKAAHQTAARYTSTSEFQETGLTPEFIEGFSAPFVKEAHIKMGLKLVQIIDIELNQTKLIIGEIQQVIVPNQVIGTDGMLDLSKAETLTISGLDTYHKTEKIARLSYAKPNRPIQEID